MGGVTPKLQTHTRLSHWPDSRPLVTLSHPRPKTTGRRGKGDRARYSQHGSAYPLSVQLSVSVQGPFPSRQPAMLTLVCLLGLCAGRLSGPHQAQHPLNSAARTPALGRKGTLL